MNACKTGSLQLPVLRFLPFVLSLTFPLVLSFILSFVLSLSKDESETIHINSLP
jgi:Na+/melibiose symporter-like transporter